MKLMNNKNKSKPTPSNWAESDAIVPSLKQLIQKLIYKNKFKYSPLKSNNKNCAKQHYTNTTTTLRVSTRSEYIRKKSTSNNCPSQSRAQTQASRIL